MNGIESKFEHSPKLTFTAPAVESLLDSKQAAVTWPEHIVNNPSFQEQTEKQHQLLKSYQIVIKHLPLELGVNKALQEGHISEETLVTLYDQLTDYIRQDAAHARIVLYFPFELLTSPLNEESSSELNTSIIKFNDTYKRAWETQLGFHEVRANFVDGDVLEPELLAGDHPRVVKATHLIPSLVERGLMTVHEACKYAESSDDRYVKDGFLDACEVMMDKGMIEDTEMELLKGSTDPYLSSGVRLLQAVESSTQSTEQEDNEPKSFPLVFRELEKKLSVVDSYQPEHSTPARATWLRKDAREKIFKEYSEEIAVAIKAGDVLPLPHSLTPDEVVASIDALRLASLDNRGLYELNHTWLTAVEQSERNSELDDALIKLYAHLNATAVLSDEELQQHGMHIPKLEGPFSENLKSIESVINEIKQMTSVIENDTYLSERVYPVTLVFGSQLKGYGTKNADVDVAVFVRPGISRSEYPQLKHGLADVFSHEKIGGKVVMFWLKETDTGLVIHDYPEHTHLDGESSWIHLLFGAAWEGNKESIAELHHQLLTNYFYDPGTELNGKPTRERWLEEMERDTLQYRLLHKGFERHYPIKSPMDTKHGKAIDGQSAFFDPRYRRIATELYLSRVFLPKLEKG